MDRLEENSCFQSKTFPSTHLTFLPASFFQFQTFTTPVQGKLVDGKSRRNVSELDLISSSQDETLNVHFPDETANVLNIRLGFYHSP